MQFIIFKNNLNRTKLVKSLLRSYEKTSRGIAVLVTVLLDSFPMYGRSATWFHSVYPTD